MGLKELNMVFVVSVDYHWFVAPGFFVFFLFTWDGPRIALVGGLGWWDLTRSLETEWGKIPPTSKPPIGGKVKCCLVCQEGVVKSLEHGQKPNSVKPTWVRRLGVMLGGI